MILNNRQRVLSKELASVFEVSQRTIQRELDTINMTEILRVDFKGQDDGYEILDIYKINSSFMKYKDESIVVTLLNRRLKDLKLLRGRLCFFICKYNGRIFKREI